MSRKTSKKVWLTIFTLVFFLVAPALAVVTAWTISFNGKFNGNDVFRGVTRDRNGNIYVTGSVQRSSFNYDIIWRKYAPNGQLLLAKRVDVFGGEDEGKSIAVDGDGNVYVAGYQTAALTGLDIWIGKFGPGGKLLWIRQVSDPDQGDDIAFDIAVKGDRLAVVGSYFVGGQGSNGWVRLYNLNGKKLWTRTFNGRANSYDYARSVAIGGDGSVYVAGSVTRSESPFNEELFIRRYSASGATVWTRIPKDNANDMDQALGIAVKGDYLYVTGMQNGSEGGPTFGDGFIRRYSLGGTLIWQKTFAGSAGLNDYGSGVVIDKYKSAYIVGSKVDTGQGTNIVVAKYLANGSLAWSTTYNWGAEDYGSDITISYYRPYVSGYFWKTGEGLNGWLRKYKQ